MACATQIGTAIFGVPADQTLLAAQSTTVTKKSDKKEGKDKCGNVVAVSWYNETHECTVEGLISGDPSETPGDSFTLATVFGAGSYHVDEVSVTYGNEEFAKATIKATKYVGATA